MGRRRLFTTRNFPYILAQRHDLGIQSQHPAGRDLDALAAAVQNISVFAFKRWRGVSWV
jgi:hypothetical protein